MTSYILVGAGGTGSHLLPALYRYLKSREEQDPDWHLHIFDGDEVETANFARQLFDPGDNFKNKAVALADKCADADHVTAYPEFVGPDRMPIQDGDVVLIAADNFFIRARIQEHVNTLDNAVVINGGNEDISGSVQLWIRENGKNVTPYLSHLHTEIINTVDADRSAMSCAEIAMLPSGGQTILANASSAIFMLVALWRYHQRKHLDIASPGIVPWTEIQFDHAKGTVTPWDVRPTRGWNPDIDHT